MSQIRLSISITLAETIILDEFNTGTYLNDQLIQNSIKKSKSYFDFLKGEEKYKFNFGGEVHQLYDLKIKV